MKIAICDDEAKDIKRLRDLIEKYGEDKIKGNEVQSEVTEGHGIGLSNVENVVRKYGGDFAISCDDKEFVAVVMIG